jgi:hypothetical protein
MVKNQYTKTDMLEALKALVYKMENDHVNMGIITWDEHADLLDITRKVNDYFTPKY